MIVSTGQLAPTIKLVSSEKEKVSTEDLKGQPYLLLFFPMAFTGVCTKELCGVRDALSTYNDLEKKVIGISVDSPFTLAQYKKEHQLNFPLWSDFNKTASHAFGNLHEEFALGLKGVSKRSAFLVDKEGVVRYVEILDDPTQLPDFKKIHETLNNLS